MRQLHFKIECAYNNQILHSLVREFQMSIKINRLKNEREVVIISSGLDVKYVFDVNSIYYMPTLKKEKNRNVATLYMYNKICNLLCTNTSVKNCLI